MNAAPASATWTPSPQQVEALRHARESNRSAIWTAVAGAGKTTTVLEAAEAAGDAAGPVAILAFNKAIAAEIRDKLVARDVPWNRVEASTMHAIGMRNYKRAYPAVRTEEGKVARIVGEMVDDGTIDASLSGYCRLIEKIVGFAKHRAVGVLTPIADKQAFYDIVDHFDLLDEDESEADEEVLQRDLRAIVWMAQKALQRSYRETSCVDFSDMIVMPIYHGVRFFRFRTIFVDEAQDTNPARRALVRALLAPGGRVIAVGDPRQAIFGFTGADADSLDLIRADFDCEDVPLTVTFRCPKAVVAFARQWVSHIEAAPSAPEGSVTSIKWDAFLKRPDLDGNAAVLCRNVKPLMQAAFALIRARVPCKIEGRDLGASLSRLVDRLGGDGSIDALAAGVEGWREREVTKALAAKKEGKAQTVDDQADTILAICDELSADPRANVDSVLAHIENVFADNVSGVVTLATIHRSKGREWTRVFWLDRKGTIPSRYARQAWQLGQESNLAYVAATRAKRDLVEVTHLPQPKKRDEK